MSAHFHALPIASVDRSTRDAVVLTLTVPPSLHEVFRFTQGQYLTLAATIEGERLRRPYSICSSPADANLRVAIKRVEGGVFSNWANDVLQPGDVLDVLPAQGRFFTPLDPAARRHYLAFAAGSGITPLVSIIQTTLATEAQSRFTLFYGNRSHATTLFGGELCELKDRYLERLQLAFVMSREQQDLELLNGRIDGEKCARIFRQWVPLAGIDTVFVCGPEAMIDAVRGALGEAGYPAERIRCERFVAAPHPRARHRSAEKKGEVMPTEVTVVQDGQRRIFQLERNTVSLLDGAAAAGIELPHSCKGGMCSTCRAKLVEGEVEMDRNYALEDYEVARGYVLCCQSFPMTPKVVVDFDQS